MSKRTQEGDIKNAQILYRIKTNDPNLTNLTIGSRVYAPAIVRDDKYAPGGVYELGWLGYYIGQNRHIKFLSLDQPFEHVANVTRDHVELFFKGLNRNKSIVRLSLDFISLREGEIFGVPDLVPFFQRNHNLSMVM